MLVVGDVLQDTARMLGVARHLVANYLRCSSAPQLISMALPMTQRGVCEVTDLLGTVHQPAAAKRLLEHLTSHAADASGTLWASIPLFGAADGSERGLDHDVPALFKSGLLRCFSLVHRCHTPSLASIMSSVAQVSFFYPNLHCSTSSSQITFSPPPLLHSCAVVQ